MNQSLAFTVPGAAVPQGSAKAFLPKGWRRPVITGDNARTKPWRACVASAAQDAQYREGTWRRVSDEAIEIVVGCYFIRPTSVSAKRRPSHTVKPDVDKLARALLDALTGLLWRDDAQVVSLTITKAYAEPTEPACVDITITELPALPTPLPAVRACRLIPVAE